MDCSVGNDDPDTSAGGRRESWAEKSQGVAEAPPMGRGSVDPRAAPRGLFRSSDCVAVATPLPNRSFWWIDSVFVRHAAIVDGVRSRDQFRFGFPCACRRWWRSRRAKSVRAVSIGPVIRETKRLGEEPVCPPKSPDREEHPSTSPVSSRHRRIDVDTGTQDITSNSRPHGDAASQPRPVANGCIARHCVTRGHRIELSLQAHANQEHRPNLPAPRCAGHKN